MFYDINEKLSSQRNSSLREISDRLSEISTTFSDFLEFIKLGKFESVIDLPKDAYGQIWTGNEARYVLKNESMDMRRFMDGLLYDGHSWFIFSQSANGEHFHLTPADECIHYKQEEIE